jgi:hypothetical protein
MLSYIQSRDVREDCRLAEQPLAFPIAEAGCGPRRFGRDGPS